MKRSAGFTLIELVIVIVILGILGAVAAPKFLDLRGDAYSANIKSLAGSLQSATTLAVTQASLKGGADSDAVAGYDKVTWVNGYPSAGTAKEPGSGILGTLQSVPSGNSAGTKGDYKISFTGTSGIGNGAVTLVPRAKSADDCYVKYTESNGTKSAIVDFNATCEAKPSTEETP